MEMKADKSDNTQQIIIQTNSINVTVIPVEFTRNKSYSSQNSEYIVEQYCNDDYSQTEDPAVSQGALFGVTHHLPTLSTSFSSICPTDAGYGTDQIGYSSMPVEWEKNQVISESNCLVSDDKLQDSSETSTSSTLLVNNTSSVRSRSEEEEGQVVPINVYLHNHTVITVETEDAQALTCEVMLQAILNCDDLGLSNPLASQVFCLWMKSSLLELQLSPSHRPYEVRQNWTSLLDEYCHASYTRQQRDEPKLLLQRDVFFPLHLEEKIKDNKIQELLYEQARDNILQGRYPCELAHYIMLGGIQARIELGPYNPQVHSTHYFREEQSKYLPVHARKNSTWAWLPISSKNSAEIRLLEQFKRIPNSATNRKLMKKYLEFCWSLPFYGCAFFEGQIEQPVRGLVALLTHQDIPVLIAVNYQGLYIIDDIHCMILLSLRFEEFNWEYAKPSNRNVNCLPCLFIQFLVVENGARVSKILQIFSKQARLADTLITYFVTQLKSKSQEETMKSYDSQITNEHDNRASCILSLAHPSNLPSLCNKLGKLTLATFDEDGHCIGQMGSWSVSY